MLFCSGSFVHTNLSAMVDVFGTKKTQGCCCCHVPLSWMLVHSFSLCGAIFYILSLSPLSPIAYMTSHILHVAHDRAVNQPGSMKESWIHCLQYDVIPGRRTDAMHATQLTRNGSVVSLVWLRLLYTCNIYHYNDRSAIEYDCRWQY